MKLNTVPPRLEARFTGVVYLLNMATGIAAIVLLGHSMRSAGDAMNFIASVLYTGVTLLLWHLLRPVNQWLSALAAVISLLGCWLPLSHYENAYRSVHITSFLFFGVYCLLVAYLIARSCFMPKFVGLLMACAGICWLTTISPSLTKSLAPIPMAVGLIGEGTLICYLLIRGLDEQEWLKQAHGLRAPGR